MDQVAFSIGSLTIHWYGVLVALGFWLGLFTASLRAPKAGYTREMVWDTGIWIIIGAILGARIVYVTTYWERSFAGRPISEVFMIHHGGLVYYGGLIGAIVASLIYLGMKKINPWRFGDVMAPSVALGYVAGRFGCLMNGCCFGRPTDAAWAIHYPHFHTTAGAAVHPTQIYDSLLNLGLYAALAWLFRRRQFDGQVFAMYLIGYAVLRSIVELFRGDYPHYYAGWITQAHLISLGIFSAGLLLYTFLARRGPKVTAPA